MTGDYYEYDDEAQRLVGRGSGTTYQMGDTIKVLLVECVPETGSMIFKPVTKRIENIANNTKGTINSIVPLLFIANDLRME